MPGELEFTFDHKFHPCSHEVIVVGEGHGERQRKKRFFLLRIQRKSDWNLYYLWKSEHELERLVTDLAVIYSGDAQWGENAPVRLVVPRLPKLKAGNNPIANFFARSSLRTLWTVETAQAVINNLVRQVLDVSLVPELLEFLSPQTQALDQKAVDLLRDRHGKVVLERAVGNWKNPITQKGVWEMLGDGRVLFNGKRQSDMYDATIEVDGVGLEILRRRDGWVLDLLKSNDKDIVWIKPGEKPSPWKKVSDKTALKVREKLNNRGIQQHNAVEDARLVGAAIEGLDNLCVAEH